ncbi:DUF2303 family protein [Sphingobium sp. LMC3-1-1.1]|uniref:DUF2303 family protein n=1 Tax=Sphingobium sp. LMC3-1-1.1 TaxID=3135241 RepID=UPI00341BA5E7
MTSTNTVADRTGELMEAAFDIAAQHIQAKPVELADPRDGTKAHFVVSANGIAPVPANSWDELRAFPLHRTGTASLTQLPSFIALVNRFKFQNSAIFACDDFTKPSLTAIFDYHPDNEPGDVVFAANPVQAMRHKAEYAFPLSKEWQAWIGKNAAPMGMGDFARFIEDHIVDVSADPVESFAQASQDFVRANRGTLATPSKLVEISRGLQVYERAVIKEAKNLSTGEAQFTFDSEHTDGDGKPLTLPTMFSITIPVFARSIDAFRLIARFRYRKTGEGLVFWYELWRPDLTFETAFNEAIEKVAAETGLPIFAGSPE